MTDLFSRSCAHWSEAGRAGMDAFYALATVDYRHLAESADWAGWLRAQDERVGDRALRLLDVACGSGKFPDALVDHAGVGEAGISDIDYALLDPSAFSVGEAKAALRPPFRAGAEYVCTLQELDAPAGAFDVVWATHALYALPRDELKAGLETFVKAIAPGGAGFIAHATEDAHYLQFYRAYLDGFAHADSEPYTSAEAILQTLRDIGARVNVRYVSYENGAPDKQRAAVEGYLQRCLFDDAISLVDMLENPVTGAYLNRCFDGTAWRFPQSVALITIG